MLAEKHLAQRDRGPIARRRSGQPKHAMRSDRDVVERGEMREQVEALEHKSDDAPLFRKLAFGCGLESARNGNAADRPAIDVDGAAARHLKMARAAQQRGLAGAGRANDYHGLAFGDVEVDIAQNRLRPEDLGQVAHAQSRNRSVHHSTGMRLST